MPPELRLRILKNNRRLWLEALEERQLLATDLQLLKDINALPELAGSKPSGFTQIGNQMFFVSETTKHGRELWKTDGTPGGTILVKDIRPGGDGSDIYQLLNVNGTLYFFANDGANGKELWRSDGTTAGTLRITNTFADSSITQPRNLIDVNGTLFFSGVTAATGVELWKTDGTASGTQLVKDIHPTSSSSPRDFRNVDGVLYFTANDGSHGTQVWRSDGAASGTVRASDVAAFDHLSPRYLTEAGGTLFFVAGDERGLELWKVDASLSGAMIVKDIYPGFGYFPTDVHEPLTWPMALTNIGGTLYFSGNDGVHGNELWRSDGTELGTQLAFDLAPGLASSLPKRLISFNDAVIFAANSGNSGEELWSFDGASSPELVKDIAGGNAASSPGSMTVVGDVLFFTASASSGTSLWLTDGTTEGTIAVRDFPSVAGGAPRNLVNFNGSLLFAANDGVVGSELWRSDGTAEGTAIVKNIRDNTESGVLQEMVAVGGKVFFAANDASRGAELWVTDGTVAGTTLLRDISPGSAGSDPRQFTVVGNLVYFTAADGIHGRELWQSDGTASGTIMTADLRTGSSSSLPAGLTNLNGALFFEASNGSTKSFWTATPDSGIALLASGVGLSALSPTPAVVNGVVYFSAKRTGFNDYELWKSNGTATGTMRVKFINPGREMANVGGTLYFTASDAASGSELWKSNGTESGTVRVIDLEPGAGSSHIRELTNVNGTLFFVGYKNGVGYELWRSDGSQATTKMVADIYPGASSSTPRGLVNADGTLYFFSHFSPNGPGLWKLGENGVSLVKGIGQPAAAPINTSGFDNRILFSDGRLFFVANDGSTGYELWESDGTTNGTRLVKDVAAGLINGNPNDLLVVNEKLFLSAFNEELGRELWVGLLNAGPSEFVSGDFNRDQKIDGADFLMWQRQYGIAAVPTGSGADGNNDGTIDRDDLETWQAALEASQELSALPQSLTTQEMDQTSFQQTIDAIYAAGDFSLLFVEPEKSYRPRGMRIGARLTTLLNHRLS